MSGIKLWFIIPSDSIRLFQEGEEVRVWPTHPSLLNACPGANEIFMGTPESAAGCRYRLQSGWYLERISGILACFLIVNSIGYLPFKCLNF